jgi:hypothetical protein
MQYRTFHSLGKLMRSGGVYHHFRGSYACIVAKHKPDAQYKAIYVPEREALYKQSGKVVRGRVAGKAIPRQNWPQGNFRLIRMHFY